MVRRARYVDSKQSLWPKVTVKQTVLYLRPDKGDGAQAWDVLTKRFLSFERPRLLKLVSELISPVKKDATSHMINNKEMIKGLSISMIVSRAKYRTQTKQKLRFVAEVQLHFQLRIVIRITEKLSWRTPCSYLKIHTV